jgi:two-component sensor histidine kinase
VNRADTDRDPAFARNAALRSLDILDSPRERDFDEIVSHIAWLCDVPTALISLVDSDRQWFKAACGFNADETPLDQTICLYTLQEDAYLEIEDTLADPRTRDNPLCRGDNPIRFYAGAPLQLDGVSIGTLCVLDRRPRRLSDQQRKTLILLARQVVRQMQLRRALSAQEHLRSEIDHRVKNSLQMVASYLRLQRRNAGEEAAEVIRQAEQQVAAIVALHGTLHRSGSEGTVDIGEYLQNIADLLARTMPANVSIEADFLPASCASERAAAAAVIVNEFVANSVKHAFPDDRQGVVRLRAGFDGSRYELMLSDDGVGWTGGRGSGFGLSIIDAAARQLSAGLERPDAVRGTVLVASFQADPADAAIARAG